MREKDKEEEKERERERERKGTSPPRFGARLLSRFASTGKLPRAPQFQLTPQPDFTSADPFLWAF
jgi:hypothetical protein